MVDTRAAMILLVLMLVGALSAPLSGQVLDALERYTWTTYEGGDALPVAEVRDIAQGADGLLYVSTSRGLLRFDGRTFSPVALEGLTTEVINDIYLDQAGRLWVLSGEAEIGYLSEGGFHVLPAPDWGEDGAPRSTGNRWIQAMFSETSDGDLWLTDDDGLLRLSAGHAEPIERFGQRDGLPRDSVLAFVEFERGRRVVVARSGFYRAVPGEGGRPRFEPFGPELSTRTWVRRDPKGVWVELLDDTVIRYDGHAFTRFGPESRPLDLDSLGWAPSAELIVGYSRPTEWTSPPLPMSDAGPRSFSRSFTTRDGARLVAAPIAAHRTKLFRWQNGSLQDLGFDRHTAAQHIHVVFEDHEQNVWLGTDRGLVRMTPNRALVLPSEHSLAGAFTAPVLQSADGSVWVGSWGAGLYRFSADGTEEHYTTADGLPTDYVRSLYESGDGTLWIGTSQGFTSRDPTGGWDGPSASDEVRGFAEGPDGRLWMATESGVLVGEGDRFTPVHAEEPWRDRVVRVLHVDANGRIWIGTENGLFLIAPDSVQHFGVEHGLRDDFIASIFEEADGTLWVGTFEHGLHRYRGDRFVPVTTVEGLHHDGIWQIVPDEAGGYWMSSDAGIARVPAVALHRVADAVERGEPVDPLLPVIFGTTDGMRSGESNRASPAGIRLEDGRIVFNGLLGITVFDPERALSERQPAPTRIEEITVDGEPRPMGADGLRLEAAPRHLSFRMSALTFADHERAEYRYRLDGYNADWTRSGTREYANYTSLGPGEYTLQVQSRLPHAPWSETASASLSIPPRLWQRTPFQLGVLLLLAAALLLAHRARVSRLLGIERMRLQIAADLHDQVGSNLSSIVLLSDMLGRASADESRRARQLERIGAAASETSAALRDVIWLVDPDTDQLSALVGRMKTAAEQLLPGPRVSFRETVGADAALAPGFQRDAFLLFKEALHNVGKHAGAEQVEIEVRADRSRLEFTVRDDGRGFDAAEPGDGYGLRTMEWRARRIGGALTVESSPGEGSTITLVAPIA